MALRVKRLCCIWSAVGLAICLAAPLAAEPTVSSSDQSKQAEADDGALLKQRRTEKQAAERNTPEQKPSDKEQGGKRSADKKPADKKRAIQKPAEKKAEKKGKAVAKGDSNHSSAEQKEAAALALVREHHAELSELLIQLKANNPKQYQQAVAELYASSVRLAQFKDKEPARYELELKAWQLDSHVRLLAAKLTMETRPELEESLKTALVEREEVRFKLLALERERLRDRLEKIERQLASQEQDRDKRAERAFDQLMRRIDNTRSKPKPNKRPKQNNQPGSAKEPSAGARGEKGS